MEFFIVIGIVIVSIILTIFTLLRIQKSPLWMPAIQPKSTVLSPPLSVIKLGLNPTSEIEFGARSSGFLEKLDRDHDIVLCASEVLPGYRPKIDVQRFEEARVAFCRNVHGESVPSGYTFTVRILQSSRHEDRWSGVVGMVENVGQDANTLVVDEKTCMDTTQLLVDKTIYSKDGNCLNDGQTQGGMSLMAEKKMAFVLYPV